MVFSDKLLIFLISAAPVVELRGAIPIGIAKEMSLSNIFLLAYLGNLVPVVPLLFFLRWAVVRLEKVSWIDKIFKWWFVRVERKSKVVEKYGFWGLVLFVAVPLPGTGAWTGSAAAVLFKVRFFRAVLAIFLGVLFSGIFVALGSLGLIKIGHIFIK